MQNEPASYCAGHNWYISATINRKSRRTLYELLMSNRFQILYSAELVDEYLSVLARPKFHNLVRLPQIYRFLLLTLSKLEKVTIQSNIDRSRDVKDNFLMAMSADGEAGYLVTGDSDLLVLGTHGKTRIVTLAELLELAT